MSIQFITILILLLDAIKLPDLIHAGKPKPDKGVPQAGTAHCTSYDFFSQHTESSHTVIWALYGRGLVKVLDKRKGLVFTRKFILFKISRLLVFNFKFRFITEDEKLYLSNLSGNHFKDFLIYFG